MAYTSEQAAAFESATGASFAESSIFFNSVLISLVLIFSIIIVVAAYKAWSKERIDTAQFFNTIIGIILLILVTTYLIN
ncbi:TIGR03758 family integrating conjugative element protein [Psychromonas sp. B3M02]|uniref:TIGR03758 family integrating conjugative element protein n=1 Tax=Psychromonas sp. B3M02 TaxID=2267226 RepID=UPI000DE87663|nr:TIGR03758 family integrating conjugative element protein [Psychromonas sp. B3M02]RBW47276.1 TIGR03758 family integrating conjugative element protein [Psychromonas sp. B3M02]